MRTPSKVSKDGQSKRKICAPHGCQISTKADLFSYPLCIGISEAKKFYEIIGEEEKEETHTFDILQKFASVYSATHSEGSLASLVTELSVYFPESDIQHPRTILCIVFKQLFT